MFKTSEMIEKFKLDILNKDKAELDREIDSPAIHRSGLELSGSYKTKNSNKNVIGWGTKEAKFILDLDKSVRNEAIKRVLDVSTPLLLLSGGVTDDALDEILVVCNEFKIPVFKTEKHLSSLIMTMGPYIIENLSKSMEVHGSLINVNGIGVMIIGQSGIGKSEAVIELVQKGHRFISDDTVVIKKVGNEFVGRPAELTKDFLEVRGIGVIDIPRIYGLQAVDDLSTINLVIELVPSQELNNVDRLGNMDLKYEILGSSIQKMQIPVENGRTLSALIEVAVNVYKAKIHGSDPLSIIAERNGSGQ